MSTEEQACILVTGATGYIGGRLTPKLVEAGHAVRVMVRDASRLQGRPWIDQVDVANADVLKPDTLPDAMRGVRIAYYLIHSMGGGDDFQERDCTAARNFATAAREAGVERIIFLGGLGDPEAELSEHLRSRHQTGDALREAGVPVTEFRAAVIVGSGSISFEMIRNLTERLPVMIAPRWVYTRTQPIAIRNVLEYLVAAIDTPDSTGQVIEIGGADVLTYAEMMSQYAAERGLRRLLIPVPVLTPALSSHWVHWMTPIPATVARPLIEGLRNEVIMRDDRARRIFPTIQPMDYRTAVHRALVRLDHEPIESTWSDALSSSVGDRAPTTFTIEQGRIIDRRELYVRASAACVYRAFTALGGKSGWLYANWAWRLRGIFDRLIGGVGFRRGRRDPNNVRVGDALDFWRVEQVDIDRRLLLRAEMIVPGKAWLQFEVTEHADGNSHLVQTAYYAPKGLFGLLYWYMLVPIHNFIFPGMIKRIGRLAESLQDGETLSQHIPLT